MEKPIKRIPSKLCGILFALCLSARGIEYLVLRTDMTALGENIAHKVLGIALLAGVLQTAGLTWGDIGFQRSGWIKGLGKGLLLGAACFAASYGIELLLFTAQGNPAHLEWYISGFSLTGSPLRQTGVLPFLLCLLFNIVNVWMEEGVFRGLFITVTPRKTGFMRANLISAVLFGIWHLVMPVRSFMDGEMTLAGMLFMGIGYMVLSGIMGVKWGILYQMTGSIWAGLGDHLFNNAVATNMLHVVSASGADELQIVRIVLAQAVSFGLVLIACQRRKNH